MQRELVQEQQVGDRSFPSEPRSEQGTRSAAYSTGGSLAAAPDDEEADAGNEDGGAADHERGPGLGCRSSGTTSTTEEGVKQTGRRKIRPAWY